MQDIGYESHSALVNLSVMSFLIVFYLVRVIFYFVLKGSLELKKSCERVDPGAFEGGFKDSDSESEREEPKPRC